MGRGRGDDWVLLLRRMLSRMGKSKGMQQGIGWEQYSREKPLRGGQAGRDWEDVWERMPSERADTRENAGDLIGNSHCVECPPEREK